MKHCEICNAILEQTDIYYDYAYIPNGFESYEKGYCPSCKKWYSWIDVYEFSHSVHYEEVVEAIDD